MAEANVTPHAYPRKIDDEQLSALVRGGAHGRELWERFGVSRQAVSMRVKILGLGPALRANADARSRQRLPIAPTKTEEKYGLPMSVVRRLRKNGATRAYTSQRNSAKHRGIGWELSFADWWKIWDESGMWHARGRGKGLGGWEMSRPGDRGPYAVGNVVIVPHRVNMWDVHANLAAKRGPKAPKPPPKFQAIMRDPAHLAKALELRASGVSFTQIGAVLGVHRTNVQRALALRGL